MAPLGASGVTAHKAWQILVSLLYIVHDDLRRIQQLLLQRKRWSSALSRLHHASLIDLRNVTEYRQKSSGALQHW